MHIGAGGHVTDPNGLISEVLTPCRLGRRSLQQAAMLASARPPCRSSAPAVSRRQSGHKHRRCMRTTSISTGRLCGDVFASDSAAMHTGAGGHANDFKQHKTLSHANDFMQNIVRNLLRRLQQLRCHRHCNYFRQFTLDPRHTNRRRDTRKVLGAKTPLL